jgi:hypothetical protein
MTRTGKKRASTMPMPEITYRWEGDYLIPDLEAEETPRSLTKYGMMHKRYLEQHNRITYNELVLTGQLFSHCLMIEEQAMNRLDFMMAELEKKDPPPSKASDPMGWVAHKNMHQAQVEEIIKTELIYS